MATANHWPTAEAKAKFSEVLEKAETCGPQTILKNGKRKAIVVSPEEWDRRTGAGKTLSQFFMDSPLRGSNIQFKRSRETVRRIRL